MDVKEKEDGLYCLDTFTDRETRVGWWMASAVYGHQVLLQKFYPECDLNGSEIQLILLKNRIGRTISFNIICHESVEPC